MRIDKGEQGFSLIEVLLVIAIMTILSTVLYGVFFNSTNVFDFNTEKINVQQDHRTIVERIAPYIRMAKSISINDSYDSSQDKLRITFSTIDDNPAYNGIGFGVKDGGELYYRKCREISPGNFQWGNRMTFISSKVNKFEVSNDEGMLIIKIELEEEDGYNYSFVEEFFSRIP